MWRSEWFSSAKDSSKLLLTDASVGLKDPCRRKFPQLVANHILGHVDRNEGFAVVHSEVVSNKVWGDHGATAPGLDGLLVAGFDSSIDLCQKLLIDKRAFFK